MAYKFVDGEGKDDQQGMRGIGLSPSPDPYNMVKDMIYTIPITNDSFLRDSLVYWLDCLAVKQVVFS